MAKAFVAEHRGQFFVRAMCRCLRIQPSGFYGSVDEHGEIAALIEGAKSSPLWLSVTGPALAFDLAVFRRGRLSTYLGIVIRHGLMIHIGQTHAVLEDYRRGPWSHRFTGHWRHVQGPFEQPVQIISEAAR